MTGPAASRVQGTGAPVLLHDARGRRLHDLRISVTDRCNFRCVYCMPKEVFGHDHAFLPRDALLTFEEIARLARIAVANGVEKLRLTGGEPLLRKGITELVAMLAELRTPGGGPIDLALTTNGSVLTRMAPALKQAGLSRVTVSLDSLDEATFQRMNDVRYPVAKVLEGIAAAEAAALGPVKVNMVVRRGLNDHDIVPMARHFKHSGQVLRFIEYMDVGMTNRWQLDEVVPSAEVLARIDEVLPLEPVDPAYPGEVSARWRYRDGEGEIGVISSVTQAFCSTCTRARVSAEGALYTCLFASSGHDLRALLRGGATDAELTAALSGIWAARDDRYSELRATGARAGRRAEMSYLGG